MYCEKGLIKKICIFMIVCLLLCIHGKLPITVISFYLLDINLRGFRCIIKAQKLAHHEQHV